MRRSVGSNRSAHLLGLGFIGAGVAHFVRPDIYEAIMPRWVPCRVAVHRSAGVAEVLLGAGMFLGRTRSWAARSLVWLLVLIFPANIDMASKKVGFRRGEDGRLNRHEGAPVGVRNWIRLPLQFVLIAWVRRHAGRTVRS
jgi:uncharacterized membrane protein